MAAETKAPQAAQNEKDRLYEERRKKEAIKKLIENEMTK